MAQEANHQATLSPPGPDSPGASDGASPGGATAGQYFLGLFILGQILFLLISNLLGVLQDARAEASVEVRTVVGQVAPGWCEEKGHLWALTDTLFRGTKFYAQATGQLQTWSLFAPAIARNSAFPAVQFRWEDGASSAHGEGDPPGLMPPGAETLLSDNEPRDLSGYVRLGNFRLRRFENNLALILVEVSEETAAETEKRWAEDIVKFVREYRDFIRGYLNWRLAGFRAAHPDRPRPQQVLLVMRRYRIREPDEPGPRWQGPYSVPVARLYFSREDQPEFAQVQVYNPVTRRFDDLKD